MRWVTAVLAMVLVVAACGDDDAVSTSLPPVEDTSIETSTTTVPVDDTPATTISTTTVPADDTLATGPTDCLDIWPEALVQTVTETEVTFFEANPDRSACVYLDLPNSIALAWRSGDRAGFEAGKTGAGAVSEAADIAVCDAGYIVELPGAGIIMEAHSDAQGRTYTATVTGIGIDEASDWAAALLGSAC